MTEAALLSAVLELAQAAGYLACHFRPARTSTGWRTAVQGQAGFPDLILAGNNRFIVAELKADKKEPTTEQWAWIHELRAAGIECYVWWPITWRCGDIARTLGVENNVIPRLAGPTTQGGQRLRPVRPALPAAERRRGGCGTDASTIFGSP